MTLNEVSTGILKESLLALEDLRRKYLELPQVSKYQGKTAIGEYGYTASDACPLCRFKDIFITLGVVDDDVCLCPWIWIEDHLCDPQYRNESTPERLARIERWEGLIRQEILLRGTPF